MDNTCTCCRGTEPITPRAIANRPGLPALDYRAGTHGAFLETMLARLSSSDYPALASLTTREGSDPAIALLDAWATVADVLTFYQERIANEGFLRTAIWRRSILELARLIGYALRPGVAASTYLAYTVDENTPGEVLIPQSARVQSVPAPGELPQTFETSQEFKARWEWNDLKPRSSKPQHITLYNALRIATIHFEGTATNLKRGDRLLLVFGEDVGEQVMRSVQAVQADFDAGRTEVTLQETPLLAAILAVLLHAMIVELERQIAEEEAAEQPEPDLIDSIERLSGTLQIYLENLHLGNDLPLRTSLFHISRIEAIGTPLLSFLPGLQEHSRRLETLGAALEAAASLLEEPAWRRDIACVATTYVDQLRAAGLQQRQGFFQEILPGLVKQWTETWNSLQEGGSTAKLASAVRGLLAVGELRDSLEALFAETYDSPETSGLPQIVLDVWSGLLANPKGDNVGCGLAAPATTLHELIAPLTRPAQVQPRDRTHLERAAKVALRQQADTVPQFLVRSKTGLQEILYQAWSNANVSTASSPLQAVYALRLSAPLFGYNASLQMGLTPNTNPDTRDDIPFIAAGSEWPLATDEAPNQLFLDNAYDELLPDTFVVIQKPVGSMAIRLAMRVTDVQVRPRTAYNVSAKTTQVIVPRDWWDPAKETMKTVRETIVYGRSEKLTLAETPYTKDVSGDTIELDALYGELTSGQWLIVRGEASQDDLRGTSGVEFTELAMLSGIEQTFDPNLPGDKTKSTIKLSTELAHSYKRDTVTLYANVVKATHGETRKEALGSGDGSKAQQSFTLKQSPLTYVAAPVPSGVESTLQVRINDVLWHEVDTLAGSSETDHKYVTQTDDEAKTTVVFGNGREGARLPTGTENVKAVYRSGIGRVGNVKAGQLSLLMTRPLGVKEVINPLPASGGADRESRDRARVNAPLAVRALDRLVSTQDYADFARTYAGIGKAYATQLAAGRRQIVHLTIAGADDIPIEEHSDLYRNLVQALRRYGDPMQPFRVQTRDLLLLIVEAGVRIHPDYQWESVEPKIRRALLEALGFERRELGQDVFYGEVVRVIQAVPGVSYVDLDTLDAASQGDVLEFLAQETEPDLLAFLASKRAPPTQEQPRKHIPVHLARPGGSTGDTITPAQLAILSSEVPDTLILKEKPL